MGGVEPCVPIWPSDPRLLGTLDAIAGELERGGWIQRYRHDDGFGPPDAAFVLCTLRHVEAPATVVRTREAEAVLARVLGALSPLGLLAGEVDPAASGATSRRPTRTSA